MATGLDIGQVPDRPETPSTPSEASDHGDGSLKGPRVNREEDVADGDTKLVTKTETAFQAPVSPMSPKSPINMDDSTASKKNSKRPVVDYVRPATAEKPKLTTEALDALMAKMRLKNDQIRAQRERIEKDEDDFYKQTAVERENQRRLREDQHAREAAQRKVQESINGEREANAQRKLAKKEGREWDSEKRERTERPLIEERGRGRGRGRGRDGNRASESTGGSWAIDNTSGSWAPENVGGSLGPETVKAEDTSMGVWASPPTENNEEMNSNDAPSSPVGRTIGRSAGRGRGDSKRGARGGAGAGGRGTGRGRSAKPSGGNTTSGTSDTAPQLPGIPIGGDDWTSTPDNDLPHWADDKPGENKIADW